MNLKQSFEEIKSTKIKQYLNVGATVKTNKNYKKVMNQGSNGNNIKASRNYDTTNSNNINKTPIE
jgi:hypothetical protein